MTLKNNVAEIFDTYYLNSVLRKYPAAQREAPEFIEQLDVTCRMCGHGFGTMPCKDAKEDT